MKDRIQLKYKEYGKEGLIAMPKKLKKRLINHVTDGPDGTSCERVWIVELALGMASTSEPDGIPTILEVNRALMTGLGGSWFNESWEARWLTPEEYVQFRRLAKNKARKESSKGYDQASQSVSNSYLKTTALQSD